MKRVILICGTGASSSFLAVKLKEAVKKRNLAMEISVSSELSLPDDIESYDSICIGPHLDFLKKELSDRYTLKIEPCIISYTIYATMDGEGLLDIILQD